ncbi:hypothetical protein DAI22_03g210000 [Oryza sativa Japonica Group]|jgi:hypothetical protein|nr:hypothetical protein DAI22_03g210000 [Oryza sativa Japonica Group]
MGMCSSSEGELTIVPVFSELSEFLLRVSASPPLPVPSSILGEGGVVTAARDSEWPPRRSRWSMSTPPAPPQLMEAYPAPPPPCASKLKLWLPAVSPSAASCPCRGLHPSTSGAPPPMPARLGLELWRMAWAWISTPTISPRRHMHRRFFSTGVFPMKRCGAPSPPGRG